MHRFPHLFLIALALVSTLANALKPLTIDDPAYVAYARQAALHPLDPYGFAYSWWFFPEPANHILSPPLLAYALAPAMLLSQANPALWKLSLFPVPLLLAYSLYALARRFARGYEKSLVSLIMLSPLVFPSLNLMLDVPTLALSLATLVVFARAVERQSTVLSALAGVMAGLAMQTKYTALTVPCVLLLYAICFGGLRRWLVAALVAAQLVLTWEFLMALLYGESHFLHHLRTGSGNSSFVKWHNFRYLIPLVGSAGWPVVVLALAALGVRGRTVLLAAAAGLMPYGLLACFGGSLRLNENLFGPGKNTASRLLPLEDLLFTLYGLVGLAVAGFVLIALIRRLRTPRGQGVPWRRRPVLWFVLAWLLVELAGFLALTPFPAVRRVMGVVAAATFVTGTLARRTCRTPARRRLIAGIVGYSTLLGLGVAAVDGVDARAQREGITQVMGFLQPRQGEGTIWYAGHWGVQHYAEGYGMRPIVANEPVAGEIPLPPRTRFQVGDWIVLPEARIPQQAYLRDPERTVRVQTVRVEDRLPWRTVRCFYGGLTTVEPALGSRLEIEIYRVTDDHDADYLP